MLYLIATPIGDFNEISLKSLDILRKAEYIICESTKETSTLLKFHQITGKKYELLNEHSTPDDVKRLCELCSSHLVALVSDCGTPGFCDPGSDLVSLCRNKEIEIKNCLGPSSLMGLISLSGLRLTEFLFRGFLSQDTETRDSQWQDLVHDMNKNKRPIVVMDTPYRLHRTLSDLEKYFPQNIIILALNLATEEEMVFRGTPAQIKFNTLPKKAEFILLLTPTKH
ncbi:MAG: methyltransferase [Deltaproteobacteria bacterium]|jgi:16S rRNA (cytidine1402-2'-O)-methyltransferase|nr:methyltransferase [Deltaproteobacteria bacterium]